MTKLAANEIRSTVSIIYRMQNTLNNTHVNEYARLTSLLDRKIPAISVKIRV